MCVKFFVRVWKIYNVLLDVFDLCFIIMVFVYFKGFVLMNV